MICTDMQPFSMVENTDFKDLINNYLPDYKLPCRTTISRTDMPKLYSEVETKDFDLKTYILANQEIKESHTAENLRSHLLGLINYWDLQGNVDIFLNCIHIHKYTKRQISNYFYITSINLMVLNVALGNRPSNGEFAMTLFISENGLRHQKRGWS